jgi:hypothetical protein
MLECLDHAKMTPKWNIKTTLGWKHGKIYRKSSYFQSNKKMVQFLTQVEESKLKVV